MWTVMWTNPGLSQLCLGALISYVVPISAAHLRPSVHSVLGSHGPLHADVQIVETNGKLYERFHSRVNRDVHEYLPPAAVVQRNDNLHEPLRTKREVDNPDAVVQRNNNLCEPLRAKRDVDNDVDSASLPLPPRVRRNIGGLSDGDTDFRRELRQVLRDTRATYPRNTEVLMNREHTTKISQLQVAQDPRIMERGVNSEQFDQLLLSSEELVRRTTRLPLWGLPSTQEPPVTPTVDLVRELRDMLRDTRATYGQQVLMNREHTTKVKTWDAPKEKVLIEHGVDSRQFEEIIKDSGERDPAVWPLIGMTTSNLTTTTLSASEFIRELREMFRDTRATYPKHTTLANHAENTSKRSNLVVEPDPLLAKHQVNSRQLEEIVKSSEERARHFPLIGDGKA